MLLFVLQVMSIQKLIKMCRSINCKHRNKPSWNKGLTKETDVRLRNFGIHNKSRIRKTYEEIYGFEKAEEVKEKMRGHIPWNKGFSYNTGENHWMKKNPKRAREIFKMHSIRMKLYNPNYKLTKEEMETKERKHSETVSKKIALGEFSPNSHYKHGIYISKRSGKQYFSSSWELKHMIALDKAGIKWTKNHGIRIKYYDPVRNKIRNYVPDFLIELADTNKIIEEIKPYPFWKDIQTVAKWRAGILFCKEKGWMFNILSNRMIETVPINLIK